MPGEHLQRWPLFIRGYCRRGRSFPHRCCADGGTILFWVGSAHPRSVRSALQSDGAGLTRYGFKDHANRILSGLFEASLFVEYRLPELFCGFYRRDGEGPVPYPVACSPQSWAAASVFLLLQSILGMKIEAAASRLSFVRPVLPEFLDGIQIKNLKVGSGSVDLLIQRRARFATVEVQNREGPVEVLTET
jgi:hypothetical protein